MVEPNGDGLKRLILGKVTKGVSKSFFRFVEAFRGDVMSALNFMFLRNHPVKEIETHGVRVDLTINVKEAHAHVVYDMIDNFISKRKLWSRGDAIEVLIAECGIKWNYDNSMTFSSSKMDIMKKLNEDRKGNQLCDVAISVKSKQSDDTRVYHAHKCVLAVGSSHIRSILHKDSDSIQIPIDCDLYTFELLLEYIYSGEIKLDAKNCLSICALANRLGVIGLIDLCNDYFKLSTGEQDGSTMNVVIIKENDEDSEIDQQTDGEQEQWDLSTHSEGLTSSSVMSTLKTRKRIRGPVVYTCDLCNKRFTRKSRFTTHMRSCGRAKGKRHCCTTCGKLFMTPSQLRRHEQIHSTERPFQCTTCGKTFKTKDGLRSHEWTHNEHRPFFCETCGKQFKFKSALLVHQKTHVIGDFNCQYCDRAFTNELRFQSHVAMHTNPPTCKICGKSFKFRNQLWRHELIHSGKQPSFSCENCGKQFYDINGLNLHRKRHTGIGMHDCPECDKKFVSKFHLKRHSRVHTGEKPYKCPHCNKSFTRADNCRSHKLACGSKYTAVEENQSSEESVECVAFEEEILQEIDGDTTNSNED